MQKITSANTSIKQVPAIFKKVNFEPCTLNFDIGCGKYPELLTAEMRRIGVINVGWDPYHTKSNLQVNSKWVHKNGFCKGKFDTVTCCNVLNVLEKGGDIYNILKLAYKLIKSTGIVYFLIYEGDKSGEGRETSKGWQNNQKTSWYEKRVKYLFPVIKRKGNIIAASKTPLSGTSFNI